jgi:hypothetical protein
VKKNVLESDTCNLCGRSAETADHIISQCPFSQRFWIHLGWNPTAIPSVNWLWEVQDLRGKEKPRRDLCLLCSSSAIGIFGITDMEWFSETKLRTFATSCLSVTLQHSYGDGACLSSNVVSSTTGATLPHVIEPASVLFRSHPCSLTNGM